MSSLTTTQFLADNYGITPQQALDFIAENLASPQTIFSVCKQAAITNEMLVDIISPAIPDVTHNMIVEYFSSFGLDATQLDITTDQNGVTAVTVNVNGTGQHNDSAQNNTSYVVGLNGEYAYTIQNFAAGDKLIFPTDNLATIINADFSDGQVIVNYAFAGQLATITLVGIPDAVDASIFGPISFRGAFGIDALN